MTTKNPSRVRINLGDRTPQPNNQNPEETAYHYILTVSVRGDISTWQGTVPASTVATRSDALLHVLNLHFPSERGAVLFFSFEPNRL